MNAAPGSAPVPARWWSNQACIRSVVRWSGSPPSWPPANQLTATVPPPAAIWRAVASAWSRPKSVSCSPWTSSVGALMRPATLAGEARSKNDASAAGSRPVVMAATYPAHTSGTKRPQTCGGACSWPGAGREPLPKNSADHARLNTPSGAAALAAGVVAGSGPARLGKSDWPRSFQVMIGIVASTRGSAPASSSASAPPYDAPVTPTRGSPGPSWRTSGRAASRSTSWRASVTSYSGEFRAICPVLSPNPRADQARAT